MFLNQLSEKEKIAFISLGVQVAQSNGKFVDSEKNMIQEYCKEMGMPFFDANNVESIDEIINVFINSDIHIRKIVLLEALGLAYADGDYDESEKPFITDFASRIGLSDKVIETQTKLIVRYLDLLKEIAMTID